MGNAQNHTIAASCQCGANQYQLQSDKIVRFYCHCEVCQRYSQKPFSDVCVGLRKHINLEDISATEFKRMKLPPNIERGLCTQCGQPSIEFGLGRSLCFIPTRNIKAEKIVQIPDASLHMFYHRRQHDAEDTLEKYGGFISSQWAILRLIYKELL